MRALLPYRKMISLLKCAYPALVDRTGDDTLGEIIAEEDHQV
jgi:hypothetical protein